jgi:hypothetical protein
VAENDYYSFEEVLKDLKLEEDELKRLVSAGEIRAFRDKNTMRFKAEDIARLRGRRVESQDVELDDLELELEDDAEIGGRPAHVAGAETIDLEDVSGSEELVLEEASPTGEVIDLGDATALGAEPDGVATTDVRSTRVAGGTRKAPRVAVAAAPVESITEGGAMLALMMVGAVILIVANFLVLDAAVGRSSSALTRAVANMFS